jgi:hypothetical protein
VVLLRTPANPLHNVNMELLPYPQAAHLRNFEANPPPTEPPLGDNNNNNNNTELPLYPPITHSIESHVSHGTDDVESNMPQTELTSSYTAIPYHQRVQKLLGTFFVSKAIRTRMGPLFKLSSVTRIERLSRRPPLIQAIRRFLRVPASDLVAPHSASPSKWYCFICIDTSGHETVAMKIPCPPRKSQGTKDRETKIYETIKERLTIYYCVSRFLPFYGVQEVQEVNV